ncbi:MAG TPA: hypothetical protein VEA38_01150 [Terriglobales bacterium]|nr:hypothetical protein [Terriglobales bacterium]
MKAILAALALTGAALGLDAALLRSDAAREVLVPDPVRVVQSVVGALAARRVETAHAHADESSVSEDDLAAWAAALRAEHGDFRFEDAVERRAGDAAEVRTRLHTERTKTVERTFRLTRDPSTDLWKVVALSG